MKKMFTCIICPNGCEIEVEVKDNEILNIDGASCKKGREYINQELKNPQRNIATSVKVIDGEMEIVSVRLSKSIPKSEIFNVMREIKTLQAIAPIKIGDVIKVNINNLNVDVIATKNIDSRL